MKLVRRLTFIIPTIPFFHQPFQPISVLSSTLWNISLSPIHSAQLLHQIIMSTGTALSRSGHYLARAMHRSSPRPLSQPSQPLQNTLTKRTWSFFPDSEERRLKRLMEEANLRSHDPEIQATYLRALGKTRPDEVVRRVELGAYATGENVAKEYVKALVATGALDRVKLPQLLKSITPTSAPAESMRLSSSHAFTQPFAATANSNTGSSSSNTNSSFWGSGGGAAVGGATNVGMQQVANASGGTATQPIHVALAEPSLQSQLWRAVRVIGTTFLVLGFVGVILEERGMGRAVGINTDSAPEPESGHRATFADVKGCDEAKEELEEIVEFLRAPSRFTRLGGKLPKGVLLMGPPGTGKTLLARAIAGEAQRPFFYSSGSEFEEMFVGVGAKRVRELFAAAKKHAPCIIFIDEIDAIGGKRNPKDQRFLTMTLNQFLVELDGFQSSEGIIVIGATNFPESLDQALVRPGRFDRHVTVPHPDVRGRTQILQVHTQKVPLAEDVNLEIIARGTPGFSGADLSNLVNIAALKAAIENFAAVSMVHLEHAKDRILMGSERKSLTLSDETKRMTAFHEGGHALCCIFTEGALPVHKATIMPRGQALGMVSQLPSKDMSSMSKLQMVAKLDVCMGGRAAEELIFGADHITSGAASDFQQATQLAEAMVTQYGMSEKLGQVTYEKERESPQTRALIESEVRKLLDAAYLRAMTLLKTNEKELHRLANALLEHETLTGEQVKLAIRGELKAALLKAKEEEKRLQSQRATEKNPPADAKTAVLDAPNAAKDEGL